MHRNVTILVIILAVILIFGYLVWLRGRFAANNLSGVDTVSEVKVLTPTEDIIISSATPEASPTAKITSESKAATGSSKNSE